MPFFYCNDKDFQGTRGMSKNWQWWWENEKETEGKNACIAKPLCMNFNYSCEELYVERERWGQEDTGNMNKSLVSMFYMPGSHDVFLIIPRLVYPIHQCDETLWSQTFWPSLGCSVKVHSPDWLRSPAELCCSNNITFQEKLWIHKKILPACGPLNYWEKVVNMNHRV